MNIELTVRAFNEEAIAFYRALGYEVALVRMVRPASGCKESPTIES